MTDPGTTSLVWPLIAVCGFMFLQDILGVGLTISQARGLRLFPGIFDGLGDFATRYGGAVVAVTAVKFSLWSWQTFLVVAACAMTSFFTSNLATGKESMILPRDRMETVTMALLWQRVRRAFGREKGGLR
jgi:hypothetical protein